MIVDKRQVRQVKDPKKPKKLIVDLDDSPEESIVYDEVSDQSNAGTVNKKKIDINLSDLDADQKIILTGDSVKQAAVRDAAICCPQCGFAISADLASSVANNSFATGSHQSNVNQDGRSLRGRSRPMVWLAALLIPLVVVGIYFAVSYLSGGSLITVPYDYPTIQQAIDAAVDGDEIVVEQGTYNETIDFMGKTITVRSENPADPDIVATTIIDGGRAGAVVTFNSGESKAAMLKGFTITGGSGTIYNFEHIEDGITTQMQGVFGGGILVWNGSSPTIEKNQIIGNDVEGYGGGIAIWLNSSPEMNHNTITGNIALIGGGIAVGAGSNPKIESNDINFNKSFYSGAGLAVSSKDTNPSIKDNLITDNVSDGEGGGIAVTAGAAPLLDNNQIANNMALRSLGGGGIFVHQSAPVIKKNNFDGNSSRGEGGGIAVYSLLAPMISGNSFTSNTAFEGGAIWLSKDSVVKISEPDDNKYGENRPDQIFQQ